MGYFTRLEYTADHCVPHTKGLCIMKSIRWYCILQQIIQKKMFHSYDNMKPLCKNELPCFE